MDREIQNICVNPLERCRDYKCKSLFADVDFFPQSTTGPNITLSVVLVTLKAMMLLTYISKLSV